MRAFLYMLSPEVIFTLGYGTGVFMALGVLVPLQRRRRPPELAQVADGDAPPAGPVA